jgi:hypothetical protein
MTIEKKIISWETVMTILIALMIISALFLMFFNFDFKTDLLSEIAITSAFLPFVLFTSIYFIMSQPFKDLLLKAKTILDKKNYFFFSFDLSVVKLTTDWLHFSTKHDKELNDHLKSSKLELNQKEQEILHRDMKKKTKYAKWILILNVGTWSTFIIAYILGRTEIQFTEYLSFIFILIGLLLVFLYLRYSYNTYILLQFNKKLKQIEETSGLSYLDIRDIYE